MILMEISKEIGGGTSTRKGMTTPICGIKSITLLEVIPNLTPIHNEEGTTLRSNSVMN